MTTLVAGPSQLKAQFALFRDGQEILTAEQPLDFSGQTDLMRLKAQGRLVLGDSLLPGEDALKITVVDPLNKSKYGSATQWIDFEIVK